MIAVTHPDIHFLRQSTEQATSHVENFQTSVTKLSIRRCHDFTAEFFGKNLKAVTDT